MVKIRDFLYRSDQKLNVLDVKIPRLRRGSLAMRGEVKFPFVSLVVEPGDKLAKSSPGREEEFREERLRKVIDEINNRSFWYSDPEAKAGCWVYFETPMNYCLLQSKYFQTAVIFSDHPDLLPDSSVRLLLHGSRRYLLNQPRVVEVSEEVERLQSAPSGTEFVYALADNVADVIRTISTANDPLDIPRDSHDGPLASGIARILHVLDQRFVPDTAAVVAGLARVTASVSAAGTVSQVERFVMATPLYVEYKNIL